MKPTWKTCPQCGKEFVASKACCRQKYCGPECSLRAQNAKRRDRYRQDRVFAAAFRRNYNKIHSVAGDNPLRGTDAWEQRIKGLMAFYRHDEAGPRKGI